MIARCYSDVKQNFKDYCDKVVDDFETIIITRERGENVVLISEAEYKNMLENIRIMGNSKQYFKLLKSNEEIKKIIDTKRKKYDLNELSSKITPENRHEETDWGSPVGKEEW
jgi:antitoxin YefM